MNIKEVYFKQVAPEYFIAPAANKGKFQFADTTELDRSVLYFCLEIERFIRWEILNEH